MIAYDLFFPPEMLLARKQLGLAAQAMHELGNLYYHAANTR